MDHRIIKCKKKHFSGDRVTGIRLHSEKNSEIIQSVLFDGCVIFGGCVDVFYAVFTFSTTVFTVHYSDLRAAQ